MFQHTDMLVRIILAIGITVMGILTARGVNRTQSTILQKYLQRIVPFTLMMALLTFYISLTLTNDFWLAWIYTNIVGGFIVFLAGIIWLMRALKKQKKDKEKST